MPLCDDCWTAKQIVFYYVFFNLLFYVYLFFYVTNTQACVLVSLFSHLIGHGQCVGRLFDLASSSLVNNRGLTINWILSVLIKIMAWIRLLTP